MEISTLGILAKVAPFIIKGLRPKPVEQAIEAAIAATEAKYEPLIVRFQLEVWLSSPERLQNLEELASGRREITADEIVEEFIAVGGFQMPDPDNTKAAAADLLATFAERLYNELLKTPGGLAVFGARYEVDTAATHQRLDDIQASVAQLLDSELLREGSTALIPLSAPNIEPNPTLLSQSLHLKINEARDRLLEGHPETAFKRLQAIREAPPAYINSNHRFRIAMNLGACALESEDLATARREFEAALTELPGEGHAMANLALVTILEGDPARAVSLVESARIQLPDDPHVNATLIKALAATGNDAAAKRLVSGRPDLEANPVVAFALGQMHVGKSEFTEAALHFERAVSADRTDGPAQLWLGISAFQAVQQELSSQPPVPWRIPESQRERLAKAEDATSQAVSIFRVYDDPSRHAAALTNRAAIRAMLGDPAKALADCEAALSLGVGRDETLANKGRMLLRLGRNSDAALALSQIQDEVERRRVAPLLAHAQHLTGQSRRAFDLLLSLWDPNGGGREWLMIAEQLLETAPSLGEEAVIREVAQALVERSANELEAIPVLSRWYRRNQNLAGALSLIDGVLGAGEAHQNQWLCLEAGETYLAANRFQDAALIYDRVIDVHADLEYRQKHVVSLFNARRYREALERAREYRQGEPLPVLAEIESLVLELEGDLAAARTVLYAMKEAHGLSPEQQLRLATINVRIGDIDGATREASSVSINSIADDTEMLVRAAYIRKDLGLANSLEFAFQARRRGFGKPEAHLAFLNLFLGLPSTDSIHSPRQTVEVDTVVTLRRDDRERSIAIVSEDADPRLNERAPSDPLVMKLAGARPGGRIRLREETDEDLEYEVVRIEHKYVAAFRESMADFGTLFPDNPAIQSFRTVDGDITKILVSVDARHRGLATAVELYRQLVPPLPVLARAIGQSTFHAWAILSGDTSAELLVSSGNTDEQQQANQDLHNAAALSLDLTAVFTIVALGLQDKVALLGKRLITTQGLVDDLRQTLAAEKLTPPADASLGKDGDRYVYYELTPEIRQKPIDFIQSSLVFAQRFTEVVPVRSAAAIDARGTKIRAALGDGAYLAILACREHAALLVADDLGLRRIARTEMGVASSSTLSCLQELVATGALEPDDYHAYIRRLIASNYRYIGISADTIISSLRASALRITPSVLRLFRVLEGPETEMAGAIAVVADV